MALPNSTQTERNLQFVEFAVEGGKASLFKGVKVVSVVEYPRDTTYPRRTVITYTVAGSQCALMVFDTHTEVMSSLAALEEIPAETSDSDSDSDSDSVKKTSN